MISYNSSPFNILFLILFKSKYFGSTNTMSNLITVRTYYGLTAHNWQK